MPFIYLAAPGCGVAWSRGLPSVLVVGARTTTTTPPSARKGRLRYLLLLGLGAAPVVMLGLDPEEVIFKLKRVVVFEQPCALDHVLGDACLRAVLGPPPAEPQRNTQRPSFQNLETYSFAPGEIEAFAK